MSTPARRVVGRLCSDPPLRRRPRRGCGARGGSRRAVRARSRGSAASRRPHCSPPPPGTSSTSWAASTSGARASLEAGVSCSRLPLTRPGSVIEKFEKARHGIASTQRAPRLRRPRVARFGCQAAASQRPARSGRRALVCRAGCIISWRLRRCPAHVVAIRGEEARLGPPRAPPCPPNDSCSRVVAVLTRGRVRRPRARRRLRR